MLKKLLLIVTLLLVSSTLASAGSGRGKGSCSYCHNGNSGNSPIRDGASGCGGCHANPPATGAHIVHTDGAGAIYGSDANNSVSTYRFNCGNCHPTNPASHGNNITDLELYNAAATGFKKNNPATAGRTGTGVATVCSNIYCHSAGQPAAFNTYTATPPWGGSFSGNRCAGCHSYPPNYTTNAPKANSHVPHNYNCNTCHAGTTTDGATITNAALHVNGTFDVAPGSGVSFTYTYATAGGTCSNISCHNNSGATWGGTAVCSACHGSPPPNAAAGYAGVDEATSPHMKHAGKGANYSFDCNECHKGNNHDNGTFQDVFLDRAGILAGPAASYNPTTRTCSSVYCHSSGAPFDGGNDYKSVAWSGTLAADCTSCHGGNALSAAPMATGKHGQHVNQAGVLGSNYSCGTCHGATVGVGNDRLVTGQTNHVDGNKTVSLSGGVFDTATRSCSATQCHQAGKAAAPQPAAPNWGGPALGCNGCHGTGNPLGAPDYPNGGAGAILANSHDKHASDASDCDKCHTGTSTSGTSINAGSLLHINQSIDVTLNSAKAGSSASWSAGSKTCSNISCHSGNGIISNVGAAQWGATLGCAGCHGDSGALATNAHAKHVNILTGKGYACATCHANTVSGSTAIINLSLHGNSAVDVAGSFTYTAANKSCAVTCHLGATPQWNAVATGACGSCHAALSSTANGLIGSNAHSAHFSAAYGPNFNSAMTSSCAVCHIYTAELAATHVSGAVDLGSGFSKIGTCSTCHQQTTNWSGGQISCESCHTTTGGPLSVIGGLTAPDKSQSAATGHGKSGIGQACAACHDRDSAHIFTAISSTRRLLPALTGSLNTECNYCHDNAAKITNAGFRNMSTHFTTKGGAQAMACATCHDPHGTTNLSQIRTTINGQTITYIDRSTGLVNTATNQGLCQVCHTQTAHFNAGSAESNHPTSNCFNCHRHNASGGAFKPNGACDSCHGYPPAPRQVVSAVTFGTMNNWSSASFENYSGGGGAHLVAQHISPTAKPSEGWANCTVCHNGGMTDSTPYHIMTTPVKSHIDNVTVMVDPKIRFSDGFTVYTGAKLVNPPARNTTGSCFNISCHMSPSPRWSTER